MPFNFTKIYLLFLTIGFFSAQAQNNPELVIKDHNNKTSPIKIDCDYNFLPPKKIKLTATYPELKSPSDYTVASVGYNQVGSFSEGTNIIYTVDDSWSNSVAIGFPFCFYGNTYTTLNVADNGVIRFGYNSSIPEKAPTSINNQTPSVSLVNNTIFGSFQDLAIRQGILGCAVGDNCGTIATKTFGVAPFRKFVINYNEVNHFNCTGFDTKKSTFQVVLYETTNEIDINVKSKPQTCAGNIQNANGFSLIGLNNSDGSKGIAPPNRNTGLWEATNESYKFTPSGSSTATVKWYDETNTEIGAGDFVEVIPKTDTNYRATVSYVTCTPSQITNQIFIDFDFNYPKAPNVDRKFCDVTPFDTEIIDVKNELIDPTDLPNTIKTIYETELEAYVGNPLTVLPNMDKYVMTTPTKVFYYREAIGDCFVVGKITLNLFKTPEIADQEITACDIGGDDTETVILSTLTPQIKDFDATTMGVLYYQNAALANTPTASANTIATATVNKIPGFYDVYARIYNLQNPACWTVSVIKIKLLPNLQLAPLTAFCIKNPDFNNNEPYDLTQIIPTIVSGPASVADLTIHYFDTLANAISGNNPIPNGNLANFPVAINLPAKSTKIYVGAEATGYCRTYIAVEISFCKADGGDGDGDGNGDGSGGGPGFDECLSSDPIEAVKPIDLVALFNKVMGEIVPPIVPIPTITTYYTTLVDAQNDVVANQIPVADLTNYFPTAPVLPALVVPIWVRYQDATGISGIKKLIIPFKYIKKIAKEIEICDKYNDDKEKVDLKPYIKEIELENPKEEVKIFETITDYESGDDSKAIEEVIVDAPDKTVYVRVRSYGCDSKYDLKFILNRFDIKTQIEENICDIDSDGKEPYDVSKVYKDFAISNPAPDEIVTIYATENGVYNSTPLVPVDLISSANTAFLITNGASIWVRIEKAPTVPPSPLVCATIQEIKFKFNNSFTTNIIPVQEFCDTDNYGKVTVTTLNAIVAAVVNETPAEPIIKKLYYTLASANANNPVDEISQDPPVPVDPTKPNWGDFEYDSALLTKKGTIYLYLESTISGCKRVVPINLEMKSIVLPTIDTPLKPCDIGNDTKEKIADWSVFNAQILANAGFYTFAYYLTKTEADNDGTPIPANYEVNDGDIIYVKIKTPGKACSLVKDFKIELTQTPPIVKEPIIAICDDLGDGTETKNLNAYKSEVISNPNDYTFEYYGYEANAQSGIGVLAPDQVVTFDPATNLSNAFYVKVISKSSPCFSIAKLVFERKPLIDAYDTSTFTCDISDTNTLKGEFNLEILVPRTGTMGMIVNPNDYTITFHTTKLLAETGGISITETTKYIVTGEQFSYVYVRFNDKNTGCFTVKKIRLEIYNLPKFASNNFYVCDDNLDEVHNLDLVKLNGVVVLDTDPFTFEYFLSLDDAKNNNNPITETVDDGNPNTLNFIVPKTEFPKDIYVKGTDKVNFCTQIRKIILVNKLQVPLIAKTTELLECDDNNDGVETFDLTQAEAKITTETSVTFTYFRTLLAMQTNNPADQIATPSSYTNSATNPKTVYVRLSKLGINCDNYATITLNPYYKTYTFPAEITLCDNNADGKEEKDFEKIVFDIISPLTSTEVDLSFYTSYNDALAGAPTIASPYTFTDFATPIFVKIKNKTSKCSSIEQLKFVKPAPVEVVSEEQSKCDLNKNGIQIFDTQDSFEKMTAPAKPIDYKITSYTSEAGANLGVSSPDLIANTNHSVSQPQEMVWIRFEDSKGCYSVKPLTLKILPLPLVGTMTDYFSCKDVVTGLATFDLSTKNTEALLGQDATQFLVSYHSSDLEAKSGDNPLPISYPSDSKTIWASIKNNTTGCRNTKSLELKAEIATTITAPSIQSTTYCDDVDAVNDGFRTINLSILNPEILGSTQSANPDYKITYYASQADFDAKNPILTPATFSNTLNPQTIITQIVNTGTNQKCDAKISFDIKVNLLPVVKPEVEILACDVDDNGYETFDLTKVETAGSSQVTTETNVNYTYFTDQTLTNTINLPNSYSNQTPNPSVIYVKVQFNATKCFSVSKINLNAFHKNYTFPATIPLCDNNADGKEEINLSKITYDILSPLSITEVGLQFYTDYNNAILGNTFAISNPEKYELSNYNAPIFVRITDAVLLCSSIKTLNFTKINPIVVKDFETSKCDLDSNGKQLFDLVDYFGSMTIAPNSPSNYAITSYASELDANMGSNVGLIANTKHEVNQPKEIVWIRFVDAKGCYSVKSLTLNILPLPKVVKMADFYVCKNRGANEATFDLISRNSEAFAGQSTSQFSVNYYESEANAKSGLMANALPSSYTSISKTIWVSIKNNLTGCINITPLKLIAETETTATKPDVKTTTVCDKDDTNDGFTKFDLSSLSAGILGNSQNGKPDYTIRYYATKNDFDGNIPITDLVNFTNTINPQTIYVKIVNNGTQNKCDADVFFDLKINKLPEPKPEDGVVCYDSETGELLNSYTIDTGLSTNDHTFEWFLGSSIVPIKDQKGATLEVKDAGEYVVVATAIAYPKCASEPVVTLVRKSETAKASASVEYSFADNIKVVVTATGLGEYSYQLDNQEVQESNVFENVKAGTRQITVYDKNGCREKIFSVLILDYQRFFTPNGDGSNDYWNIKGITDQPDAKVYVFDRYGKLLKQVNPQSEGWDGKYNGQQMPSDDYWFTVNYTENGEEKVFKSHFAMKR
jgi:large repetitive protein